MTKRISNVFQQMAGSRNLPFTESSFPKITDVLWGCYSGSVFPGA